MVLGIFLRTRPTDVICMALLQKHFIFRPWLLWSLEHVIVGLAWAWWQPVAKCKRCFRPTGSLYDLIKLGILVTLRTRGNSLKILNRRCHYDLKNILFCNRITNVWNSLAEDIVTAPSVNSFKNRLDKFWSTQELKYNWQVEITWTGSRSEVLS